MQRDLNLDKAISMGARLISANLRNQVPVKTGKLKRSIRVQGMFDGNSLRFSSSYLYYGKFLDLGTGTYKTRKRGAWNPAPGKGRKGIRPRFWTTIERTVQNNLKRIVAKIVRDYIKFSLSRKAL